METVILKPLHHRDMDCIGIYFAKNNLLQSIIQKQVGGKWSKSNGCWYIKLLQQNYQLLAASLSGKAILETGELKKYLNEKKKANTEPALSNNKMIVRVEKKENATKVANFQKVSNLQKPVTAPHQFSKENTEALQQFSRQLHLKAYSQSTIKTYTNEFTQFLQTIKDKPASGFIVSRLKDYFEYCYTKLHLSENTLHSRINAMKFYYEQVLGREKFFWEIPRPKKHLILPKVLGEEELRRLFEAANNLKHKAILFAAYSAGLRVSEVINLRLQDIDRERKQLFVYCSKGKKDRYVALSPLLQIGRAHV